MSAPELHDDEIARSLARKAFSYHVTTEEVGPASTEAIRETLLMVWEDAGSPSGAFLRAASRALTLADRIAEDDEPRTLERMYGITREQEVAFARQAAAFLERLALELG